MRILLVEDDSDKCGAIVEALMGVPGIEKGDLIAVGSIIDAKRFLLEQGCDIMLLDIQLPMRSGGRPKIDGGVVLIEELHSSRRYNIPSHVIGLTAFESSAAQAEEPFRRLTSVVVKYDRMSDNWRSTIVQRVEQELLRQRQPSADFDYDVAIVVALERPELAAVLSLPYQWSVKPLQGDYTVYHEGVVTEGDRQMRVIAAAAPQMGMPAAAVLTSKLLRAFRPRVVVMAGIAAAVKGEANYGDILVADPSFDLGSGKWKTTPDGRVFLPDPMPLRLHQQIASLIGRIALNDAKLQEIRAAWPARRPETALQMKIGPIASGAAVVADYKFAKEVQRHWRKLLGIELETYGVFYAVQYGVAPHAFVVSMKSVTDFANAKKNDEWQEYAAYTSAKAVDLFIREIAAMERSGGLVVAR